MPHRTTNPHLIKLYKPPTTWIRGLTRRMFAALDAAALQRGWQVSSTHGGFGRSYRDPRFDTLASCGDCLGRGIKSPGGPCRACRGTGWITASPAGEPAAPPPRGLA